MKKLRTSMIFAVGGIAVAAPVIAATTAQAKASTTVYVSAHAAGHASDRGCGTAAYHSITAASAAVAEGGTVIVCGGTYKEDVAVTKALTIQGRSNATIDATKLTNGFLVTASHAAISGFTVKNAVGEGILVNKANSVTVQNNVVSNNDLGGLPVNPVPNTYASCAAQGGVPGDCGEGIHLMGSSHSTVRNNVSTANSGGILVSDETAPAAHNRISGNVVARNTYACGITVVAHSPLGAPGGKPAPDAAGVYDNDVVGNTISDNGTQAEGAGVVLATGLPGGAVYDNTVEGNSISGNGLSGVTLHSHIAGQYLNGNVIRGNRIGTNNLRGDKDIAEPFDTETTGILVGTVDPLSITISGNVIGKDHYGVWTTGPVTAKNVRDNHFTGVTVPVITH
ncbi:right-handed parallel beta-helix repeat-containing protein [Actinoallomurus bryophytorum]|nr:right-handed parallel beta-helix repeat-containing protein [Actinoallomurus bryophytorum]